MKTTNWMAVLVLVILLGNVQTTLAQDSTRVDYQQKSKNQKTAAWVMLGGGIVLGSIGITQAASNEVSGWVNGLSNAFGGQNLVDDGPDGTALMIIGGAATLGSIPLFMSSSENARRAARMRAQDLPKTTSKQNKKTSAQPKKGQSQ